MTIKQLRYIVSVADNQFNISHTAEKLHTSQPGISKQIKLLEENLDCAIFVRNGKSLQGLSEKGKKIIQQARIILAEYDNLLTITKVTESEQQHFSIATTSTQSNYVLPAALKQFHQQYPQIQLNIQDGNMDQLIEIGKNREADCLILSGINHSLQRHWFPNMLLIPCFDWYQLLVCHKDSPLAKKKTITLADIAEQPIITYPTSKYFRSALETQLCEAKLENRVFATSNDPNTIKKYAASNMGIGIIAPMAYDNEIDKDLVAISLDKILPKCTTIIAVERHNIVKPHVYRFIRLFAPHLSSEEIENAINSTDDIDPETVRLPDHIGTWVI